MDSLLVCSIFGGMLYVKFWKLYKSDTKHVGQTADFIVEN